MSENSPVFALNHMCAPQLSVSDFLDLAQALGAEGVEIRNDIEGNALADGTDPADVGRAAAARGLHIFSINALQRFNAWDGVREREARALIGQARACGAQALVLVPTNDGTGRANGERQANLRIALKALAPLLAEAGIVGLVEPLGFESCSLRHKSEAVEAIESLGLGGTFRLVHDTFHHFVAGESAFFPAHTGLVHLSGVTDGSLGRAVMRDGHRVLVDDQDRLDNVGQVAALRAAGYAGPLSFEPFSETVHRAPDLRRALADSMALVCERVRRRAA
ncbi:TIM barrel protein [Chelativorans intermedius]|uniref:TIM barrel protein n=1 Tax=Chelativorans intermedius TaxID=515947 RepID=A0ABV6D7M9_9HYPH|nr:TIM barrel protein [Chelativorans intermedius]MCT8999761.1 TIM barrel protein [Chelativorans intermedius]